MEALGLKEALQEVWETPVQEGNIEITKDDEEEDTTPLGDEDTVLEEVYNEASMATIESDIIKLKEVKLINKKTSDKVLEKRRKFKRIESIDLPVYTCNEEDMSPPSDHSKSPFVTIEHNREKLHVRKSTVVWLLTECLMTACFVFVTHNHSQIPPNPVQIALMTYHNLM